MLKLLKADFTRVLKDKLFVVICILGVIFALVTPLLYLLIVGGADSELTEVTQQLGFAINAKTMFFESFSFGNNFGLIVPVLVAIVLCKDFSHGTVRNKIIGGSSRNEIFFSMYITCAVTLFTIVLAHALITLGFSLIFFPYQQESVFSLNDFWYLITSIGLELLLYLFMAALICFLCVYMKNVGLVVVLYVALSIVMTMVAAILQVGQMALEINSGNETAVKIIEFAQNINVFNYSTVIGVGTTYETETLAYTILTPLVLSVLCLLFGSRKFRKKDLR